MDGSFLQFSTAVLLTGISKTNWLRRVNAIVDDAWLSKRKGDIATISGRVRDACCDDDRCCFLNEKESDEKKKKVEKTKKYYVVLLVPDCCVC